MKTYIYTITISLLFVTGCKVAQPVALPAAAPVPATLHPQQQDSSSIADLSWKQFFTDPLLQSLIDTALQHNPDLQIAMQRIETSNALLLSAKNAALPSVNVIVSGGIDKYGDYTMNGVGNYDTNLSPNISGNQKIPYPVTPDFFLGLRSNWEIDVWHKLKSRKKSALAQLAASQQNKQLITTILVSQIAGYYYQLMALDHQRSVIRRNTRLQEDALEVVKAQKEGGRATQLAVQQMEAQLYNTRTFEFSIRRDIAQAENQVNYLLGRFPQPIARDSGFMQRALPAPVSAGLPSALLLRRPDIREAEWQLEAAKADVAAARAAFMPSFQITPYAGLNAFKAALLFNGPSFTYGILGSLTAPLFNQKQIKANYLLSTARNKEAWYQYQKTILNSFREVGTTIEQLENTRELYQLKQKQVAALREAVASSRDLYVAGYASYLEVITAQKGVLDAELELNEARKNQFLYLIDLYRALGGGK